MTEQTTTTVPDSKADVSMEGGEELEPVLMSTSGNPTDAADDVEIGFEKPNESGMWQEEEEDTSDDVVAAVAEKAVDMDEKIEEEMLDKPMREVRFTPICFKEPVAFNPLTSLIGFVALWGLAIWCMVSPDSALEELINIRGKVSLYFTWIIVIAKPISFFFIVFIAFKFGHVRFGGKDAKPEFSSAEYFCMLFAAGVAVGIFYYGVSEPLWHQSSHWFAKSGFESQDAIDQFAMTLTIFHWGFHVWGIYLTVAVTTALAAFRFRLPVTFRSCFYPIFGEYTWGWIGDVIDGFSIVVTVAGVCTSLGVGATQIAAGLQRIGWVDQDPGDDQTNLQTTIIWVITAVATASVISGLNVGIKYLSLFAFCLGMLLTFLVFVMEKTAYLLNVQVQTIGHYFQYAILQLAFHTDAFGQLRSGEGRNIGDDGAEEWWMDTWTIFYWNWWTSWACFVGLFVARISRGRTIGEVVFFSLVIPLFYCIMWFGIWGGIGLRQSRQALELEKLGETYFGDPAYYRVEGSEVCYNVPQEDVVINGETVFTNYKKGITPVCTLDTANSDQSSYNVLYSFSYPETFDSGFGPTLTVMFLFAIAVYFATSSDSGSLVVDFLASNGRHEHHWLQRLFWALTEGAVATALLNAGGTQGLQAVQAASIIAGLPFTVMLLYLLQTMYEMCVQATDDSHELYEFSERQFNMPVYGGIFNVFEYIASCGSVHPERVALGIHLPTKLELIEFAKGLFIPFVPLYQVLQRMHPKPRQKIGNMILVGVYTCFYFLWIGLFASMAKHPPLKAWGWGVFFMNAVIVTAIKMGFRSRHGIHGNIAGDFVSSLFLYPQVFAQMRVEQLLREEEDLEEKAEA